jgi:hypothetical protein
MQNNHIYVFNNTFSDDLCDRLISLFENNDIIKDEEVYEFGGNVLATTIGDIPLSMDKEIFNVVTKITYYLNRRRKHVQLKSDSGYCLRKIRGKTRLHVDSFVGDKKDDISGVIKIKNARKLSLIFALNSDYEGGELCFPDQDFKIKLKKGQAIAFPVYWTHPHYTNELYNNTFRYTINTWLL